VLTNDHTQAHTLPHPMVEEEHQPEPATPPAETRLGHIEPGPPVEFGLLPGQHLELSLSAEGLVRLRVTAAQAAPISDVSVVAAEPEAAPSAEPQERVTVSGRLGGAPSFRTTPKGVRVARFTVAEHTDTESTTWRTVLAFGKRAESLEAEPLEKGQAVEVIGYPHEREVIAGGVKKTVEEIYATAIKRR
jgi:Single-strand binding protein family